METHLMLTADEFKIKTLGPCTINSPLARLRDPGFIPETSRIRYQHKCGPGVDGMDELSFEESGPRERIFFDPATTTAAVATCGGLSPGLNSVIRSVYAELAYNYLVPRVLGVRYGYMGLNPASGLKLVELTTGFMENIHYLGGTVLGSSRGHQDPSIIVDTLERESIDILFCVGGDGTQRGASVIHQEITRRGLRKAVVGIQDDRQRYQFRLHLVWLQHRSGEGRRGAAWGPRRSPWSAQRHRPGQTDGAKRRLHCGRCSAGQPGRELRPDPRGPVPARREKRLPL